MDTTQKLQMALAIAVTALVITGGRLAYVCFVIRPDIEQQIIAATAREKVAVSIREDCVAHSAENERRRTLAEMDYVTCSLALQTCTKGLK